MNAPQHSSPQDAALQLKARKLYREAAHRLDPATAGRLRAARRTALEAAKAAPAKPHGVRMLLPTGALAAIALAVLLAWSPLQNRGNDPLQAQADVARALDASDELPPDPASADPSLYQNLDFYGWLAQNNGSQANH